MKPLVAIISNPGSTTNRASLPQMRAFIEANSGIVHVEFKDFADIPEALAMCKRADPSVLVINGGDGTIQATLSALVHHRPFGDRPPLVAVLPGGKTNMIAKDLGMRGSPISVLRKILELVKSGKLEERRTRRALIGLNLGDGSPTVYGMFFGASGIVSGIEACRAHVYPLKLPDILSHVATTALMMFGVFIQGNSPNSVIHSEPMRINLKGGGIIDGTFFVVMASTLNRLIMGTDPFTSQGMGSIKFTAIEHRRATAVRSIFALLTGRLGKAQIAGVHYRRADVIRIFTEEMVTLDGEMFTPQLGEPIVLDGSQAMDFVGL